MDYAIMLVIIVLVAMTVWNFVPSVRAWFEGKSTILETMIGGVLYYTDVLGSAVEEANKSGYIPDDWQSYVPALLLLYIIGKRLQTKTPVGG